MSPEWEYRYYSINSKWDEGEMMASMRNGSGDEYFILFDSHGAIMKGFDHDIAAHSRVASAVVGRKSFFGSRHSGSCQGVIRWCRH